MHAYFLEYRVNKCVLILDIEGFGSLNLLNTTQD